MKSLDELPQRERAHDTADAAETAFCAAIETCNLFIVQQKDRNDYGTDVQIEAREGKAVTNIRAHVQLKGTESAPNANGSISVAVARTNLNYLLAQAESIYVCYHLPSKSLLVRHASDVYREYEHRNVNWIDQDKITINFSQPFDEEFQQRLNKRLLAVGRLSRSQRLQYITTPPEQIAALVRQITPVIEVPVDPEKAREMLTDLYKSGNDTVISNNFEQFAAVLDSVVGAMDLGYMAEINLGINGLPFNKSRVRQGIKVLREAMGMGNIHPGSLLYCIGNGWLALHEHEKARDVYQDALTQLEGSKLDSVVARCCMNLGSVVEKLGEINAARGYYERALEFAPGLNEAHFALAMWHRRKGDDLSLALDQLDQVIRQNNSAVQMSTVQGWRIELLFNTGDTDAAFREVNNLLGEANQLEWVWPWCARQVACFGRMSSDAAKKALLFWRAYLYEHPGNKAAERERLFCLFHLHTSREPIEIDFEGFKHAIIRLIEDGDPDPAYLWDRIGHWAQDEGEWAEAEKSYRKAYELDPKRYGYCLGTSLNFLDRYRDALPILIREAEEYQPDAMSWFQVAVAREGGGDIKGSISAYQRAIELDDNYDLAWFNLGGIYWNSQDHTQAANIWKQAMARFPNHELVRKLRKEFPFLFNGTSDQ